METGEMAQEMSETFCKSFNGKRKKVCAKIWGIRQKYNNIILSSIQRCDIQHNDIPQQKARTVCETGILI